MNKRFKRIASLVLSAIMAISLGVSGGASGMDKVQAAPEGASVPSSYDSASLVNYATILGRATDYGIVAKNFTQSNHMQSTFAVVNYSSLTGDANDINLLLPDTTAHVMVGNIDTEHSAANVNQPIKIGSCTTKAFIFEAPKSVFESGKIDFANVENKETPKFTKKVNENTSTYIQSILNNVFSASANLEAKCKDSAYALPDYSKYLKDDQKTFDFTGETFKGKVIYINVDSKLLDKLKHAEGIRIDKDPSTVIVFNIGDEAGTNLENKVRIDKYSVSSDGKNYTYTDPTNEENDKYICQKIIWNITTHNEVSLGNTSGLFIVPNAKVDVANTSSGWIVANDLINSAGEWHFFYRKVSQELNEDKDNQLHFRLRKSFTHDWKNGNTTPDTSVDIKEGDYTFEWYETGSDYKTDGKTPELKANEATSYVKFPVLTFYGNEEEANKANASNYYVQEGTTKSFYYVVKEQNAGKSVGSVKISEGYVNIKLDVTNTEGQFTYKVTSETHLGDENKTISSSINNEPVPGLECDLGVFFNKIGHDVTINKVAIAGGPEIGDAVLELRCTDADPYVFNENTKAYRNGSEVDLKFKDGDGFVGLIANKNFEAIRYETVEGAHTTLTGLKYVGLVEQLHQELRKYQRNRSS